MVSCVLMFKVASAGKRIRNDVRTAFMPFSCCAALRNMMVRSCQRTLRSAKSSHGFLACTPLRLFFSFSMSSRSPSQSALPCSCFRAVHRKTHGVKSAAHMLFYSSNQATGSAGVSQVFKLVPFHTTGNTRMITCYYPQS